MEEKTNKIKDIPEQAKEQSFDSKLNRLSNNLLAKNVGLNKSKEYL